MRRLNLLLALAVLALLMPAARPALAETDVDVHVGQADTGPGLDWDLFWSTGMPPAGVFDDLHRRRGDFGSGIQPYAPFGTHPNDRGGYRLFIPRGIEYPPQYYGAGARQPQWPYGDHQHQHHGGYNGYPIVIPYDFGYTYYGQPGLVYTAPCYPELGYYRQPYSYQQPYGYQQPTVNNDNRVVNNYYYGYPPQMEQPQPPATPAEFQGPVRPAAPPAPAAPAPGLASGRAYGQRFYDQTRLEVPEGVFRCELRDARLTGYIDGGKGYLISSAAEMRFGAFALYEPGVGFSVIFREGAEVLAAYPAEAGKWWLEPLPYAVDFSQDVSLGLIGGQPWVAFDAPDATRYVISFSGRAWQEVGNGTRPKVPR